MGLWDAVASAGPYANNLLLASDREWHQHIISQFLQAGCSSWRPTDSVKALMDKFLTCDVNILFILQFVEFFETYRVL